MTEAAESVWTAAPDRRGRARRLTLLLLALLLFACLVSLSAGATATSPLAALQALAEGRDLSATERIVLVDIRLPRLFLGLLVGAGLAMSGTLLQGLFRNPLADPGLVGVSAGASLGAVLAIVLGSFLPVEIQRLAGTWLVAIAALAGAWITVVALYGLATRSGQTSVATMLLAGIALAALAGAATGVLVYIADDAQLRDLTFWSLGSLAGANWLKVMAAAPVILAALALAPFQARALNALALGEAAATHVGIDVQTAKSLTVLAVAAGTGAAVAVAGTIGFVGIVVPHLLRLAQGPDHAPLIVNSALLGAALLVSADALCRTLVAPAELPIGILTALLGAPVFLWILLRSRSFV